MVQRSHYSWGGAIALPALACAHALRGAWVDAEDTLDTLMEPGRIFQEVGTSFQTEAWVYRQWLRAYSGETDAVSKRFAANPQLAAVEGPVDVVSLSRFCALVEIGDLIAAPAMVQEPYQALLQAAERDVHFSSRWVFLIPRVLGVAAALNQWWDQAEAHFQVAIEVATSIGARPELGRSYLDYARMLAALCYASAAARPVTSGSHAIYTL